LICIHCRPPAVPHFGPQRSFFFPFGGLFADNDVSDSLGKHLPALIYHSEFVLRFLMIFSLAFMDAPYGVALALATFFSFLSLSFPETFLFLFQIPNMVPCS